MKTTSEILNFLNKIKKAGIIFYCNPPNSNSLINFLRGLSKGFIIANNSVTSEEYTYARFQSISLLGWEVNAFGPIKEMQAKGLTDEEIIQRLIDIETKTWELIEESKGE